MHPPVNARSSLPVVILSVILLGFGLNLFWRLEHGAIAQQFLIWKQLEVRPLALVSDTAQVLQARLALYFRYKEVVTLKELWQLGQHIGLFYVAIPVAFSLGCAARALRHPILRAARVQSMQSLIEAQRARFSAIAPILRRDLTDDASPEWASSRHPEEWVKEHQLIVRGQLDILRTREQLIQQLGKRINALSQLKPHERALFAVFGLRAFFKDVKGAQQLMDALSAVNRHSRPDFALAQAAFQRCASAKTAPLWLTQHPYPRTLLMALLIEARTLGVLPSSHFIWLKPLDRALWYALNTAGRKVPFIESAGVFNQMQAERIASHHQCCLTEPHVEEAIKGLQRYLEDVGLMTSPGAS
ncbi:putative conjugal transfer TrbA-like protein [Candidatus Glomeribacter gigasporarum BEG34]|uniref:Putative conjugal transfer TrbA-like protein n=1 Tax=Candidatus Glomeribacter gigasporarum BEG34 TaxID=1070319 RepID=G2JBT9_9BURK|nr:hypothetical protein [Candidatus Glomeribacter gigasporarum]CCD30244.1 putative conjugal transfer TrbA-like protein [Candidatus Glomeribacter gigasporarum BEG34]